MLTFTLTMSCFLSTCFLLLNHPLSFGLILLLQTILISLISGLLNYNFWFSYILFLIMVGGMLILFIYMTSIASNEKFKFSIKVSFILLAFLSLALALSLTLDNSLPMANSILQDLTPQDNKLTNSISLMKFLNWPMNMSLYMIIVYLLMTLIMVVKITNIQYGPLRQKF